MRSRNVLLVGCGVMGAALKQGWEQNQGLFDITIIEPSNSAYLPGIDVLPQGYAPDAVIFAVKPQIIPEVLPPYRRFSGKKCLFISIAAGVVLDTYYQHLGSEESIIRVMPNLPVVVGQGMVVLTTRSTLSGPHKTLAEDIFKCSGHVLWVDKESLMDIVTAVSGSGPAYFFRMVECLAAAGIACGLPSELAMQLARQTAIGAGAMLQQLPEGVTELRRRVTSPGGTTAAAVSAFDQEDALAKLTRTAVKAAIHRGRELAQ